jgi:hypothetical protein
MVLFHKDMVYDLVVIHPEKTADTVITTVNVWDPV